MNDDINDPDNTSGVPWPTSIPRAQEHNTSMLPGREKAGPAAVGMLKSAARGAHETIDRFAESAAPAVRQLGENAAAAEEVLHEKADQLRNSRDRLAESVRATVRRNPLACISGAFALGAVIARITR